MYKGHGAVVIGSETSGGIRDIVASNIVSHGTERGIRIKSMRGRGNTVENLRFDNFVIDDATEEAIEITTLYRDEPVEPLSERTPIFRNFAFSNLTIVHASQVASIHGLPEKSIEQLRFSDIMASGVTGFICDHSTEVELHDVRVDTASGNAFVFEKVTGLELDDVASMSPQLDRPVLDLTDCNQVSLRSSRAAAGTNIFLAHRGEVQGGVRLINNDLSAAKIAVYPRFPPQTRVAREARSEVSRTPILNFVQSRDPHRGPCPNLAARTIEPGNADSIVVSSHPLEERQVRKGQGGSTAEFGKHSPAQLLVFLSPVALPGEPGSGFLKRPVSIENPRQSWVSSWPIALQNKELIPCEMEASNWIRQLPYGSPHFETQGRI